MNSIEASEDVVQEVYVHLWQKRKKLKVLTSLKSYLFSSVKNKSIEKIRRQKLEIRYIQEKLTINETVEPIEFDDVEKLILINRVHKSIDRLPPKCSAIFKMSKMEGMTYNEIAENLDLSVKTIESQMRRAFMLLREMLS